MNVTGWAAACFQTVRQAARRPVGIAANMRWLFAVLALATVLICLPAVRAPTRALLVLAVVAALVIATSVIYTYTTGRTPVARDVVDAVAIAALATASATPSTVLGITFAGLWFAALYGSTWRSLVRFGLYTAALCAALLLRPYVAGNSGVEPATVLGAVPTMFITAIVALQLGRALVARDQNLLRDSVLAAAGQELLHVTDRAVIRQMCWSTAAQICDATPGLRLLKAVRSGGELRVEGTSGEFAALPMTLPGAVIATGSDPADVRVADHGPLDRAVGSTLEWVFLTVPEEPKDAWLLVGAPKGVPMEAILAVRSLVNEVSLALRTSDAQQELEDQARVDSLTGLANRAAFTAELARHLTDRERAGALHVLFLDLDDFKAVNDVLGHRAGDELLIDMATRLRTCTRPEDTRARLGGDEFAVVLHDTTDAVAVGIARRMVRVIAEPAYLSGRTARVGVSIGIAAGTPDIDIEELLHRADVAQNAAKEQGKGRVQVFNPSLLHADASRLALERQLAAAAGAGELVVHYQPIISLGDLRCLGFEALVRWNHPERGLLQPGDFIETAERSGAIIGIGAHVLRQACADIARWQADHPSFDLAVHINVSARQLDHDHFIDTVQRSLSEFGVAPSQLVLELTETVVLDSPAAIERLEVLSALGVKIAIDDFGTGYSSLSTLRSLPVDVVKLDRTFIAGALANPIDRTVIGAIVQMSAELGLQTIAEGVEHVEQQRFLETIGTNAVQGFLHLRPVPAGQLATWLRDNLAGRTRPVPALVPVPSGAGASSGRWAPERVPPRTPREAAGPGR